MSTPQVFTLRVKSFERMNSPFNWESSKKINRFVMFADINTLDKELASWFHTNPRYQNTDRAVSQGIKQTLIKEPQNFHNLNRGILFSAKNVAYNPLDQLVSFSFENEDIHGNIDGGHTLKVIYQHKEESKGQAHAYVFVEIITGLENHSQVVNLAKARNKNVPVDEYSLANLDKKFDSLKEMLKKKELVFQDRIMYKANEDKENREEGGGESFRKKDIKVDDVLVVLNIFNLDLYPDMEIGTPPAPSYRSKNKSLKKFLNLDNSKRKKPSSFASSSLTDSVWKMQNIVKEIFELYDLIETDFPTAYNANKRKYGSLPWGKITEGRMSKFMDRNLSKVPVVPEGIIYPILGAFKGLVRYNDASKLYEWVFDPIQVWKDHRTVLAGIIGEMISQNKDLIKANNLAGSSYLWHLLFKEIQLYVSKRQPPKRIVLPPRTTI